VSRRKRPSRGIRKASTKSYKVEYILLGTLVVGAFLLRVLPQLSNVFVNGMVWYRGVDAWYHMRMIDNMMSNYPLPLTYDLYAQFPNGAGGLYLPLFNWVVATLGHIFNYEVVGAYLPPIIGALTLIPIYFLCRELFSGKVGLLACLLASIIPGEFLHRTLLGFTDHHALEVLLMVCVILFMVLAIRRNRWLWRVLTGVFLGLYMLNWGGSAFLLSILGAWAWFLSLRGELTSEYIKNLSLPVLIAISMSFKFVNIEAFLASGILIAAPFIVPKMYSIIKKDILIKVILIIIPIGLISYFWESVFAVFYSRCVYIQEAAPSTPQLLVHIYGILSFMAVGGIYYLIKNRVNPLIIAWSVSLMIAVISQRRWGYYSTIPIAILASYLTFQVSSYVALRVKTAVIVIVCFFMVTPLINQTIQVVNLPNLITNNWVEALTWLRSNTPEPIYDNAYYELEPKEEMKYGILSWWDYGHWIIRIGHRAPLDSPTKSSGVPSKFLVAQKVEEANELIKDLNIKYIIMDETLLIQKWYAVVERSGNPRNPTNLERLWPNSMLVRLWNSEVEGYNLIYDKGGIKIFEVVL